MFDRKPKILVVDDSALDFEHIKAFLQEGMKETDAVIEHASSYSSALSHLDSSRYDVCLLDDKLHSDDGLDLLHTVRRNGINTPVIFLTGQYDQEVAMKAMRAGALDFLVKQNLSSELLMQCVRYAVELNKKEDERRKAESAKLRAYDQLEQRVKERTEELSKANELLKLEVAERKHAEAELKKAHLETNQLLSSISSILIGVGPDDRIKRWNAAAERTFEVKNEEVYNKPFTECGIKWNWDVISKYILECKSTKKTTRVDDVEFIRPDSSNGFLGITINPVVADTDERVGYLLLAADITERKSLESQLSQAQKLESIGQLAAGIAHEINTPIQYVGDNTRFLQDGFGDLSRLIKKYDDLFPSVQSGDLDQVKAEIESTKQEIDTDFLLSEIPEAINQSLEGVERVADIVRAMKEFSHPGVEEKTLTDINKSIENTITVARNEWKYVAEIEKDLDTALPPVPCLPGELNQVFLNMIINAAHAIADVVGDGSKQKGTIKISTQHCGDQGEIRISDTGSGIPVANRSRIFDPFFTTKEVGKGTGQGLAISHNVVVDKHGGSVTFETEEGKGTTFIIRLPMNPSD